MSQKDFLVELGTEELPPKALKNLGEAFHAGILKGLKAADLSFTESMYFMAPRRLAVIIKNLKTQQDDRTVASEGPPVANSFDASGNPSPAALGFAKKCGVDISQLDRSGTKLKFTKTVQGEQTNKLLPQIISNSLNELPIPKRMRWGSRREEFVRPTQWLVMLFGEDVLDCEILAQKSGRLSYGHRFHHPAAVSIAKPTDYIETLKKAHVFACFNERKEIIRKRVNELAAEQNAKAIVPDSLLEEVSALVEFPVPLICSFEEKFLSVPQEALIATMQDNQKYFCLLDANGKLKNKFITIANINSKDPSQIISGNEKVVRPRLTDAEFFFKQDQKKNLESFNERLKNVVFQAQLGTVYEKAERVSKLAGFIAEKIQSNPEWAQRAGILSKADLATEMVGEFPEMQGIAGYYYAKNQNEPNDVALALNEQYMPRGAGAELPQTTTGVCVAIADKIDTLVGIFGIGMLPTGSKDPYALRRAALGVLRISIEKKINLDLLPVLDFAVASYGAKVKSDGLSNQVLEFIYDRLRAKYEEDGIETNVYQSVRALNPTTPLDFESRVVAVQAFKQRSEAAALAAANKRVANILSKASPAEIADKVVSSLLTEQAEINLAKALDQAAQAVAPLSNARNYQATLEQLAHLREPIDAFFNSVLVNAEDLKVRANRYAMLKQLRELFLGVADISFLQ